MTCDECGKYIAAYPCPCGYGAVKEGMERLAHPATVVRSTYQPIKSGITKEEFGLDLFEAIKLQSGLRQAQRTAKVYRKKGLTKQVAKTEAAIKVMQEQLQVVLNRNTIAPADIKRLLAIP